MPRRHHRHTDHDVDVDDDGGPLTLVDPDSGMPADDRAESIADAVDVLDEDLSPEEAALHIERDDLGRLGDTGDGS